MVKWDIHNKSNRYGLKDNDFFLLLVLVEGVMRWGHPHAKISPADPFPSRITLRKVFYSGRKNVWFWSKIWRRIQRSALALYIFPILCLMVGVSSSHASEFIGVLGNCGCRVRSPRGRRLHEGRGSRVLGISNALTPASYPLISHGVTRAGSEATTVIFLHLEIYRLNKFISWMGVWGFGYTWGRRSFFLRPLLTSCTNTCSGFWSQTATRERVNLVTNYGLA